MKNHAIAIRVDASAVIGLGHASRCLALAAALRKQGCRVVFLSSGGLRSLAPRAADLGCDSFDIGVAASEAEDARASLACLRTAEIRPAWIVVDAYGLGAAWHDVARAFGPRLLCIDDLANRRMSCDAILDQNLVADMHGRYDRLLPSGCRTLLGPRYALLSEDYAALRVRRNTTKPVMRRIVISFGGADPVEATLAAVIAFTRIADADIIADVVVSSRHPQWSAIAALAGRDNRIRVIDTLPSLSPLLAEATIAVGGAGTTSWERLCLGVPSIAIPIADNQRPIAHALAAERLACVIDHSSPRLSEAIEEAMRLLLLGAHGLRLDEGMRLCDGLGATRVALSLLPSTGIPLTARAVNATDRDLVFRWANDPETRRASLSQRRITEEEHDAWFTKRIEVRDDCVFMVVTGAGGMPMGSVRFERDGEGSWILSFVMAPEYRGLGLAKQLVATGLAYFTVRAQRGCVVAMARRENLASQRILDALGFRQSPHLHSAIAIAYQLELGGSTQSAKEGPEKAA